ncbi:uncharacterized protein LOC126790331 [Argentina anserina]|uniref:uncharacterized protein LOC126790331 n=1 Tax=Argentina anserina TaxID=57926 RepID=UPI002176486C|nr:uncharacterized protein LOC126790331 [Potentilla anserina]
MFLRKGIKFASAAFPHFILKAPNFGGKPTFTVPIFDLSARVAYYSSGFRLSPLFPSESKPQSDSYDIELVDDDAWRVSSGLALADEGMKSNALEESCLSDEVVDEPADSCSLPAEGDPDFDDIDNLRVRGRLFFKIDRDSKEYEEYSFDFHRRNKSSKKKDGSKESKKNMVEAKESKKKKVEPKESKQKVSGLKEIKKDNPIPKLSDRSGKQRRVEDSSRVGGMNSTCVEKKKLRTTTYNQLTGPFHEPFCLDVYISKASVRACIVHRFTSKVVAVAHSISKDMKFDLGSTRNAAACAAVGEVLAQRALGDDIHDVIYTPRKGERLEGKLQIVVQSLIDNGVNVKVKIKQRTGKKSTSYSAT